MHKIEAKKQITLPYRYYTEKKTIPREKKAKFRAKKAPSTNLQKLGQEKNIAQLRAKKAPHTSLKNLCQEKKCTHSRRKST